MKQYIITEEQRDALAEVVAVIGNPKHSDVLNAATQENAREVVRCLQSLPELPAVETDAETMQMAYDYIMGCLAVTHDQQERDHIENILMRMAHPNRPAPAEPETCEWKYTEDINTGQRGWLSSCGVFLCYDENVIPAHISVCPEWGIDDDTGMMTKTGCGLPITIKPGD